MLLTQVDEKYPGFRAKDLLLIEERIQSRARNTIAVH
jgi:hypothetical protein